MWEVHFFTVIMTLWTYGYLEKGVVALSFSRKPITTEIYDKVFYLAHGDGLGDPDPMFLFSA